ncbi:MAG: hypothetical protein RI973_30 [Bacteroidota bacterium]|jgi:Do/DeqQ family serine protease
MKNTWQLIATTALLTSLLTIMIVRMLERPRFIYLQNKSEDTPALATYKTHHSTLFSPGNFSFDNNFIAAANAVTPAVVNIRTIESIGYNWWNSNSFGASSGSGVIISPDGYIVTNNHVIEEGTKYEVTLNDQREFSAQLLATDPQTDLALLKIDAQDLPFLVFGNSDSLLVGEWVLAVGNPFNLASTVTAGIVSAKGRSIDVLEGEYTIESFIQTDAAVNPGNSGGALVNTRGELIGINTAIITKSGKYEGYSFAIPSTLVNKVVEDLRLYGEVQRGLLGVQIRPVTSEIAKELELPAVEGVLISSVFGGGAAAESGLQSYDIIVGINNLRIRSVPELQEQIGRLRPGSTVNVEYLRDGKRRVATVTLKGKPRPNPVAVRNDDESILQNLGFSLRDLNVQEKRRLRASGVYVEEIAINSIIESTEMDPGYIITKVGDVPVSNVQEVVDQLLKNKGKKVYLEGFYESYKGEYYYTFVVK